MSNTSASALYGSGVFTTVRLLANTPFRWDKHWKRLTENAAKLDIDISSWNEESLRDELEKEIIRGGHHDGRARITFSDKSPSDIWGDDGDKKTGLSIITAERREVPDHFKLTISPYSVNTTSPLVGIKSCNYMEHLMADDEAKGRGFHEAIRLNERGEVASACMANVFWTKDERLFTPSLKTGCLAGTTREFVLENLECKEVETGIKALREADSIFLTSAGIGIVQVAQFQEHGLPKKHPITELLPMRN